MPVSNTSDMITRMNPVLTDEVYVFCTCANSDDFKDPLSRSIAMFRESEGVSFILPITAARELGFDTSLPMRLITLSVHSALDGVGLTAAVASSLAALDIPCNVVAAYHHDHVFVPASLCERALQALLSLSSDRDPSPGGLGET